VISMHLPASSTLNLLENLSVLDLSWTQISGLPGELPPQSVFRACIPWGAWREARTPEVHKSRAAHATTVLA
jgi:hypothetical protein